MRNFNIKEISLFSITFISSRTILFFFPLLFAIFLDKKNFIIFEQALGIANMMLPILTLGFFSLLPKILNSNNSNYNINFIKTHNILLVILLLFVAYFFSDITLIFCSAIFTIFFIISRFLMRIHKVKKERNKALILETSFFIILGFAIIIFQYKSILIISYFFIPFILLYAFTSIKIFEKKKIKNYFSISNWPLYLKSAIPNLFSGFVVVFIFQYLKVIVPVYFDENESYNFLYIFRFSFIVLISYQFFSSFFYVNIINKDNQIRNKRIYTLAILNFFMLFFLLLVIYLFNDYFHLLDGNYYIKNYFNINILYENFRIFLISTVFLHIFSFITLNNMVSVALLHEEKIWLKFLIYTILSILIFTFINHFFLMDLENFLIYYLFVTLGLYVIHSLLIKNDVIHYKVMVFNLLSLAPILAGILII